MLTARGEPVDRVIGDRPADRLSQGASIIGLLEGKDRALRACYSQSKRVLSHCINYAYF
jgi:hypothetical protein